MTRSPHCLLLARPRGPIGVRAQVYPAKPVRWIVPYAPRGFVDTRSRQLAARLADLWKQPVVVDNRPGAGGVIGTEVVARAASDGYTIGMKPRHPQPRSLNRCAWCAPIRR